jgi:hypothetical protein
MFMMFMLPVTCQDEETTTGNVDYGNAAAIMQAGTLQV